MNVVLSSSVPGTVNLENSTGVPADRICRIDKHRWRFAELRPEAGYYSGYSLIINLAGRAGRVLKVIRPFPLLSTITQTLTLLAAVWVRLFAISVNFASAACSSLRVSSRIVAA
jgi:hypothetical protein